VGDVVGNAEHADEASIRAVQGRLGSEDKLTVAVAGKGEPLLTAHGLHGGQGPQIVRAKGCGLCFGKEISVRPPEDLVTGPAKQGLDLAVAVQEHTVGALYPHQRGQRIDERIKPAVGKHGGGGRQIEARMRMVDHSDSFTDAQPQRALRILDSRQLPKHR